MVLLDPGREVARVLFTGDAVDIVDRCWPLMARPLEVESYLEQQLVAHSWLEAH